jgi:hypothetical protein
MIRDPRPVSEQVKSGFKIAGILLVVCAALLVLVSYLPIHRIEAWAWHWRHGNSVQVGEFTLPVPNEWGVERFDVGGGTQEVLLANTKGGKAFGATITITEEPWRVKNMVLADLVSSRQRMMANLGIHVTDTRQLAINGITGFCLDGETAMMGTPVRNISCYLGTTLSIEYFGSPLKAPSFYSILDGVSRASKG